ncbi:MAG: AEC family transporter [Rhodospirillales bacterium]|nr:AEC family transporter [Rhodospirillales bacterium]QQS14093.1 MAG: AEC family transporter [Rhodospirillales bacterium]
MGAVLDIVAPVLVIALAGYALGRTSLLSPEGLRGFGNATFYILFACLLFRSMAKVRLETLDPSILLAFFGGALGVFGAMLLVGRYALGMAAPERAVLALSSSFSNGVGLGIPLVTLAFGEDGLVPLLMIISVHSLILLTLTSFLIELGQGAGRGGIGRTLLAATAAMFKHPVLPAIFAGLLWGALTARVPGLALPAVLDRAMALAAQAAAPCGLIMLGASLAHVGFRGHWREGMLSAAVKLVALPALVYVLGRYVFRLDPLWLTVATIDATLPAGANVYLIAQRYGAGVGLATNGVVLSTLASVVTVSVALMLLGVGA